MIISMIENLEDDMTQIKEVNQPSSDNSSDFKTQSKSSDTAESTVPVNV